MQTIVNYCAYFACKVNVTVEKGQTCWSSSHAFVHISQIACSRSRERENSMSVMSNNLSERQDNHISTRTGKDQALCQWQGEYNEINVVACSSNACG